MGAFLLWFAPALAAAAECPAESIDEHATVERVTDGDTVRLTDGRQVRLIGLNTPELGRDGESDEPFARDAQKQFQSLIEESSGRIGLRIGDEAHDRYDRLLAHLYLPDGRNVTRLLLDRGLGLRVAVPPNLRFQDCYAQAEQAARNAERGVWSGSWAKGTPADHLPSGAGGFDVVTGRIQRVGESEKAFWLELDGLTLRLGKADLQYFDGVDPHSRKGERLRVRGWIYRADFERRMDLRHPAAVEWMND